MKIQSNTNLIFGAMAALGREAYAIAQLREIIRPLGITETGLRTALSRLTAKGQLTSRREGRNTLYSFSSKGRRIRGNVSRSFRDLDWQSWDESWWGVIFSIPQDQKEARHPIRKKLKAYRFGMLFPGFWARPYHPSEALDKHLESLIHHPHCRMIRFQSLSEWSPEQIAQVWALDEVNRRFQEALIQIKKSTDQLPSLTPDLAFAQQIHTGASMVTALFQDPMLPPVFLPLDWRGPQLRKKFKVWEKAVVKRSMPFIRQIFK